MSDFTRAHDESSGVMREAFIKGAPDLSRRRLLQYGTVLTGGLVLAACGGGGSSNGSASGKKTARMATSVSPDFSQVPLLVGLSLGLFEEAGLKIGLERMAGNVMPSALLSGDIDYVSISNSANFNKLKEQGRPAISFARQIYQNPNNVAVSKAFLKGKQVDLSSPVEDRLKALKGSRWAAISPDSAAAAVVRYLMGRVGYKVDRDYSLTYINSVTGISSALESGQIDAFATNSPGPQQIEENGKGVMYINLAEDKDSFPAFKDMTWSVLWTTENSLQKEAKAAESAVLGMWRAQKLIQDDPEKAKEAVRPAFKSLSDKLFDTCWDDSSALYPPDPRMDPETYKLGMLLAQDKAGQADAIPIKTVKSYYTNRIVDAVEDKV